MDKLKALNLLHAIDDRQYGFGHVEKLMNPAIIDNIPLMVAALGGDPSLVRKIVAEFRIGGSEPEGK